MTARQHHYIPQCYLKGFVEDRKKPKLFATDIRARKSFSTHPKKVACERDFHRIDMEGLAPDILENSFSVFETELDQALRRIVAARSIEDFNNRTYLFNLVGLIAIKNPRWRKIFADFEERVFKQVLRLQTATPERWESQVRKAREAGYVSDKAKIDYQSIRSFVESDEYNVLSSTNSQLALELNSLDGILPCLRA
jgi:hypothetical protein